MKIACIGEVMIELSPLSADTAQIGVAGDTFNTAVYLQRALGQSHEVAYVTALGDEAMSDRILDALRQERLSTELIETRKGGAPGLYMISRDAAGERSFSYWRSAAAARSLFEDPCEVSLNALDGFDIVYLSGISAAILPQTTRDRLCDWIDGYRQRGGKLAFDSNYRPRLWEDVATAQAQTMRFWSRCDIALPSVDDEMELFGETEEMQVVDRLKSAGVAFGALKRGPAGPLALDGSGELSVTAVVDVVDTTAAGDSFNAGFLSGVAQEADIATCMQAGHDLSCEVIRHPGAIIKQGAA